MDEYEQLEKRHYGALGIKHSVGPNLIRGLVISILFHSALVSIPAVSQALQGDKPPVEKAGFNGPIIVLPLPGKAPAEPKGILRLPRPRPPISTKRVPSPAEDVEDTLRISVPNGPVGRDHSDSTGTDGDYGSGGTGGEFAGFELPDDPIPPDTVFIPVEITPQELPGFCPAPEFPELAKIVRMSGKVTVNVFVDRSGDVKKWKVMQVNPSGFGFEDEVLKVIPQWKFTPAIQQGRAVGVWVAVPFTFNFKK